ncbi:MAG: phytanoyl-CoA dioxygenase family protein [Chloroflexota bacterium]
MADVTIPTPSVKATDLEVFADKLDLDQAKAIYQEHGCLVVRGLMKPYIANMKRDIMTTVDEAIATLDQAKQQPEGWATPNGCLFLPAPENYIRDKQIMTVGISYFTSETFLHSAMDKTALDIVEAILGPNIETFGNGQSLVKEPVGGHPKHLHQDAAYFEHKFEGPVALLNYVVDTDLQNGALHVVPGSHKMGVLDHVDTFSHLGLDEDEWPWEASVPIEGKAGDSIFFNVKTVHGSKPNYSDEPRPVFINRYRRPDDFTIISATTTTNRAEAEKRAAEAKKTNEQRGLMVRGFRNYQSGKG